MTGFQKKISCIRYKREEETNKKGKVIHDLGHEEILGDLWMSVYPTSTNRLLSAHGLTFPFCSLLLHSSRTWLRKILPKAAAELRVLKFALFTLYTFLHTNTVLLLKPSQKQPKTLFLWPNQGRCLRNLKVSVYGGKNTRWWQTQ